MLVAAAEAVACLLLIRHERAKRRLAEYQAAESRNRMVELQKLARIGTWEFDLVHDQIRWSPETFRIFGLPPGSQEPEFADLLLAIDAEDRSAFDRAIQLAIAEGLPSGWICAFARRKEPRSSFTRKARPCTMSLARPCV